MLSSRTILCERCNFEIRVSPNETLALLVLSLGDFLNQ